MSNHENRPEYISCIAHDHADKKGMSWCGKKLQPFEWAFVDIEHAVYNHMNQGRLLACPGCVEAIRGLLGAMHKETTES